MQFCFLLFFHLFSYLSLLLKPRFPMRSHIYIYEHHLDRTASSNIYVFLFIPLVLNAQSIAKDHTFMYIKIHA